MEPKPSHSTTPNLWITNSEQQPSRNTKKGKKSTLFFHLHHEKNTQNKLVYLISFKFTQRILVFTYNFLNVVVREGLYTWAEWPISVVRNLEKFSTFDTIQKLTEIFQNSRFDVLSSFREIRNFALKQNGIQLYKKSLFHLNTNAYELKRSILNS